jgi:hypothetical protein
MNGEGVPFYSLAFLCFSPCPSLVLALYSSQQKATYYQSFMGILSFALVLERSSFSGEKRSSLLLTLIDMIEKGALASPLN